MGVLEFLASMIPTPALPPDPNDSCWGHYDPTEKISCEYSYLSEEDRKIDESIRKKYGSYWVK